MSSLNGANAAGTISSLTSYHKGFNPPEGGEQQVGVGWKMVGEKRWSATARLSILKPKPNKMVRIKNNASAKDTEVLMECLPSSELLASAATNATGAKMYYTYTVSINFPVPNNEDIINMHQAFSGLMQELIPANREMIVEATTVEDTWTTTQDLPTGNTFNKAFNVKQETRNGKPCVVMYCTLKSTWKWKELKGNKGVFRKEELVQELKNGLTKVKVEGDKTVDEWKENNPALPKGK
eukprot:1067230-Ditylum_brightwellii.AAC.1